MDISNCLTNKRRAPSSSYDVETCKICDAVIRWSYEKLSSHKRSGNCKGQQADDIMLIQYLGSGMRYPAAALHYSFR
jgi:hypothetical protein